MVANDLPINVNDSGKIMSLVYIDDVITELINGIKNEKDCDSCYCEVPTLYQVKLGDIADLIYATVSMREDI